MILTKFGMLHARCSGVTDCGAQGSTLCWVTLLATASKAFSSATTYDGYISDCHITQELLLTQCSWKSAGDYEAGDQKQACAP